MTILVECTNHHKDILVSLCMDMKKIVTTAMGQLMNLNPWQKYLIYVYNMYYDLIE